MYTATVLIEIKEFVPMNGSFVASPSCIAIINPPKDTSAEPEPYPVFSGDGQSITITLPKGYKGLVQLTYQMPTTEYVLLGVAFKSQGTDGSVGQAEFPAIDIVRDIYGGQMTVTDSCANRMNDVTFHYVLLVQEVASANIGLIDPDVETETGGE